MVSFIDGFKKYSDFDDEIIVRCNCGCEMLTFSTSKSATGNPSLYVVYSTTPIAKISKKEINTYIMAFPSVEAIG